MNGDDPPLQGILIFHDEGVKALHANGSSEPRRIRQLQLLVTETQSSSS